MTRLNPVRSLTLVAALLALTWLPLAGCASTSHGEPVSAQAYAQPQKTIGAAQAMGADRLPTARLYLSYAQDGVAQADQAIQAGEHDLARLALARAQADANLALTLTHERQMTQQVDEINQRIQRLNSQIGQ